MNLPERVFVTDVGPRDGLQSETAFVPTERKIAIVEDDKVKRELAWDESLHRYK